MFFQENYCSGGQCNTQMPAAVSIARDARVWDPSARANPAHPLVNRISEHQLVHARTLGTEMAQPYRTAPPTQADDIEYRILSAQAQRTLAALKVGSNVTFYE